MAIQETRTLPPQFIQDLGEDLSRQILAQTGVPTVATGLAGISKQPGESDDDFAARQQAAREFETRQQSLKGLAPTVEDQTQLQKDAQALATQAAGTTGLASFQPFLDRAQTQADEAARLAGVAETGIKAAGERLETAGTTLEGVPLGAQAFQQDVSQFMSPYQSQVIDATLQEFDRNKAIQEQQIRDQQTALGALGSGRAGVQLAEFGTGAARERELLQANLLQQGFQQAQGARQQDIQNRFGLGQAQAGLAGQRGALAGATQGLGSFRSQLGGQQAALGAQQQQLQGTDIARLGQLGALNQAQQQAQLGSAIQGLQGTDITRLGQLGSINQAQRQAELDAQREATRMAAFQPQEELNRFADITTGIMGGMRGTGTTTTNVPNPTPLQTALGVGSTLAGIYGAFNPRPLFG